MNEHPEFPGFDVPRDFTKRKARPKFNAPVVAYLSHQLRKRCPEGKRKLIVKVLRDARSKQNRTGHVKAKA